MIIGWVSFLNPTYVCWCFIISKEVKLNNHNHDYLLGFVPQPNLRLLLIINY
ncbi:hypothetical protein [Okeania sp.]|uniref:hypothetical protein n=1 Tax=Okeania sp. TaxID=3100323 RepID=UPI002B4AF261|nr:hypothetical protein [Okeania sp.]